MKKQILSFSIAGICASSLFGCTGGGENGFEIPSLNPPVTTPTVPEELHPYTGSRLYLDFRLRWEGDEPTEENDKFVTFDEACFLNISSPETTKNCTIAVPEARLFYSDVSFKVGTDVPEACPIVHFQPYYYRRSYSQTFINPKENTELDCRAPGEYPIDPMNPAAGTETVTDKLACYGGAATNMKDITESSFLKGYRGLYFVSSLLKNKSYEIPASNTVYWYGANVNYLLINDATTPNAAGPGGAQAREAGTWVNYKITCETHAGTILHTINLTVSDLNEDDYSSNDNYPDWD